MLLDQSCLKLVNKHAFIVISSLNCAMFIFFAKFHLYGPILNAVRSIVEMLSYHDWALCSESCQTLFRVTKTVVIILCMQNVCNAVVMCQVACSCL